MKNLIITLEEGIPHYDVNGNIMQMTNFKYSISANQEEGQTPDELRREVEEEFTKSRNYCAQLTPIVEKKLKKFNAIIKDLKTLKPELGELITELLTKYK